MRTRNLTAATLCVHDARSLVLTLSHMDEDNRDPRTDHHRLVVADARARVFVTVIPVRRVTRNCSLCYGRDPKCSGLVLTGGDADAHDIDVWHGSAIVNNAC